MTPSGALLTFAVSVLIFVLSFLLMFSPPEDTEFCARRRESNHAFIEMKAMDCFTKSWNKSEESLRLCREQATRAYHLERLPECK